MRPRADRGFERAKAHCRTKGECGNPYAQIDGGMEKRSRRGPSCRERLVARTLSGVFLRSATTYRWLHERETGRYDGLVG